MIFKLSYKKLLIIIVLLLFALSYYLYFMNNKKNLKCQQYFVYNEEFEKCILDDAGKIELKRGDLFTEYCIENGGIVDAREESENYGYCLYEGKKCLLSELRDGTCILFTH